MCAGFAAAGADLDTSYTMAQGLMDGDLAWVIGGAVPVWWVVVVVVVEGGGGN